MGKKLTKYENQQVKLIKAWKAEKPSVISKSLGVILSPVTWVINKIIPEAAIRGALAFTATVAEWLSDTSDILRDGKVGSIKDLKTKNLKLSDELANKVHDWAIGIGTAEGAATGLTGLPGMVFDIPAIITLALRTVHKIGLCYGYEVKTKKDKDFVFGVMAASGSNDMKEKIAALAILRSVEVKIAKQTFKNMAEKAAQDRMSQEAAIIGIKNLAKQLGINLTKRKCYRRFQ